MYLPAPVDKFIEVPFLVDTGASWTTLHWSDLLKFGPELAQLPVQRSSIGLRVVGGATLHPYTSRAGLALVHNDGSTTFFRLTLALVIEQDSSGLPALLGMDVLSHGVLRVDPHTPRIEFDVPSGRTFDIPSPA